MNTRQSEDIIISNWDKVCRICLTYEAISSPVTTLGAEDEQHKMKIIDMLNICSGINYSPDGQFPQLICSSCISHMYNVLEFRTKCENSENLLAKLFHQQEGIPTTANSEESDIKEGDKGMDNSEMDDPTKNIVVTDFLRVDYSSVCDKDESNSVNENLDPEFSNINENTDSKNVNSADVLICTICQTSYSNDIKLATYKKLNVNACWQCNVDLNTIEEFNEHLRTYAQEPPNRRSKFNKGNEKYLCTICGDKLSSSSALTCHIRIHKGEKKYECNYCGKKFLHWSVRRYHVRNVHTLERPYVCEMCGNRYIDKPSLTLHIRNHTGEKPFQCSTCDKKFKGRRSLREHMHTHTGLKRKFCEVCDKGFSSISSLKMHMVTHTGERRHVCTLCRKTFTQAHALRSHMKRHLETVTPVENEEEEIII